MVTGSEIQSRDPDGAVTLLNRLSLFLHSIRFRLALWFALILGVVIVLFSAFIYIRQIQDLRSAALVRLELKEQRLRASSHVNSGEYFEEHAPLVFPTDPSSGESLLQEGDIMAFVSPTAQILQSWGPADSSVLNQLVDFGISKESSDQRATDLAFSARINGKSIQDEYAFRFSPVYFGGNLPGFILLGSPVDPNHQLSRLLLTLISGVAVTMGIALAGGFWYASRAMRPVKTITQAAREIGETDLNRRLKLDRKDELGELAGTFDGMLDRLQAAFERQRQFTADASHELRTPLTIVELETSRALAAQRKPQEYERVLKVIHSENQFMTHMVVNLLTLARMDAGQVVLQKEELDLGEVALDVVERLASLAAKEGVKISVEDLPELPVLGDRGYLVQMLTNLVENAIKHVEGEDRRVWVEAGSRAMGDRPEAWIHVTDNGPGIPLEHLPHLFDRFYQVDTARARQQSGSEDQSDGAASGTGLGLSIAQWIARAHGGDIRVESVLGEGTTFEVTLGMVSPGKPSGEPDAHKQAMRRGA